MNPVCLSELTLRYFERWKEKARPEVPPPTPDSVFDFEIAGIPSVPTKLDAEDLEIPLVKDIGVKRCINYLGEFFNCKEFQHNMLQFWFLQMITDLLWRLQDKFCLPLDMQKVTLKWVLYMFNLVRG